MGRVTTGEPQSHRGLTMVGQWANLTSTTATRDERGRTSVLICIILRDLDTAFHKTEHASTVAPFYRLVLLPTGRFKAMHNELAPQRGPTHVQHVSLLARTNSRIEVQCSVQSARHAPTVGQTSVITTAFSSCPCLATWTIPSSN